MITEKPHNVNWNFYIALEKDLENISRYIEFSKPNLGTYSIELSRLLFSACSEVEVVAKQLCKILDPSSNPDNINKYAKVILKRCPKFINETIFIERYGMEYKPWLHWTSTRSPGWWKSYNNVKHQRDEYFHEASLQNAINSLGALLIILFYYYGIPILQNKPNAGTDDVMSILEPQSSLIHLDSKYYPASLCLESYSLSKTILFQED